MNYLHLSKLEPFLFILFADFPLIYQLQWDRFYHGLIFKQLTVFQLSFVEVTERSYSICPCEFALSMVPPFLETSLVFVGSWKGQKASTVVLSVLEHTVIAGTIAKGEMAMSMKVIILEFSLVFQLSSSESAPTSPAMLKLSLKLMLLAKLFAPPMISSLQEFPAVVFLLLFDQYAVARGLIIDKIT